MSTHDDLPLPRPHVPARPHAGSGVDRALPASPAGIARSRRIRLADELNREWERLCRGRSTSTVALRWLPALPSAAALGGVVGLDDVLRAAGHGGAYDDEPGDRVLAALVGLARADELAARLVLQRILAGLIRTALRRGKIVRGGPDAAFAELVSAAWLTIRAFPIERRPRRVAANLLRDIEYQAFVRESRRGDREVGGLDEEAAARLITATPPDTEGAARGEWTDLLRWARRRGIDAQQLDLLELLAAGRSSREIAALLDCTDRTVRNRRDAAVAAVRHACAEAAACDDAA